MMYNPPHPGLLVRESIGPDGWNLSVTEAAARIGISRVALSRIVNARSAITAEVALRMEQAGLGTAYVFVGMQANHELWQARVRLGLVKTKAGKKQRSAVRGSKLPLAA